jgi:drug/metabolite transporter (DMT)-like permease
MPTKISEKKLAVGIICIILGVVVLLNTTLVSTPIKVSEIGILLCLLSVVLIASGIMFFRTSRTKMQ